MSMPQAWFWTFALRTVETAVQASPYLLLGMVLAAGMDAFIDRARLRSLFRGPAPLAAARAWLFALVMPVCSLGVLPVGEQMLRAGVRPAAVVALLVSAPVCHPWSVIYGLSVSSPAAWLLIAAASLTVASCVGWVAERWMPPAPFPSPPGASGSGEKRGRIRYALVCGLVGTGMLAAAMPAGAIEQHVCAPSRAGIPWLTVAMLPAWVPPEINVVQVREALRVGLLPGAAVPIALSGGGLCLAAPYWMLRRLGVRAGLLAGCSFILLVVGWGLVADVLLGGSPLGTADSHAFDGLTRPWHPARSTVQGVAQMADGVRNVLGPTQLAGLLGLAAVTAVRRRLSSWLHRLGRRVRAPGASSGPGKASGALSRWRSWGLIAVVVVACAISGLYVYYPPVQDVLEDIDLVHVELFSAVRAGRLDTATWRLGRIEVLVNRLPVAGRLRCSWTSDQAREWNRLQDALRQLGQALARKENARARSLVIELHRQLGACRRAHEGDGA